MRTRTQTVSSWDSGCPDQMALSTPMVPNTREDTNVQGGLSCGVQNRGFAYSGLIVKLIFNLFKKVGGGDGRESYKRKRSIEQAGHIESKQYRIVDINPDISVIPLNVN